MRESSLSKREGTLEFGDRCFRALSRPEAHLREVAVLRREGRGKDPWAAETKRTKLGLPKLEREKIERSREVMA